MKLRFAIVSATCSLLLAGCDQPAATANHRPAATGARESRYKQTGNRSADLLNNYSPDDDTTSSTTSTSTARTAADAGLAQRAGTASMGAHR